MVPRAHWKGFLKLSLVSCPVALYPAVAASERISFRQVNKQTGNRLRQQLVEGLEITALTLCTLSLIGYFLTGFVGYFVVNRVWPDFYYSVIKDWEGRVAVHAARLHGLIRGWGFSPHSTASAAQATRWRDVPAINLPTIKKMMSSSSRASSTGMGIPQEFHTVVVCAWTLAVYVAQLGNGFGRNRWMDHHHVGEARMPATGAMSRRKTKLSLSKSVALIAFAVLTRRSV